MPIIDASPNGGAPASGRREPAAAGEMRQPREKHCHTPQVLGDGGQHELVLSAARAAQTQSGEPQDALQVREPHLDALAVMPRLLEGRGAGQRSSKVPGPLVEAARYLA